MKKKVIATIIILILLSALVWVPLVMVFVNMFKINNFEKPVFILNESYDEETDITTYEGIFYTITVQDDESVYEAIMTLHSGKIISALIADKTYDVEGNTEYHYDSDFMDENEYAYFLKDTNQNYFIIYDGEPIKITSFLEDNSVFEQYENGNIVNVDMAHINDSSDIREGVITNFRVVADGDEYNIPAGVLTILTDLGYSFNIEFEPDYNYDYSTEHYELIYFLRTVQGEVLFVDDNGPTIILNDDEFELIEELENGDIIKVEYDYVMESYPAQTSITDIEFVCEGELSDVPTDIIESLEELGRVFE